MTALAAKPAAMADPLQVFLARAEARAYLWRGGEFDNLHEAVDPLQEAAVQYGLVDELGQDAVARELHLRIEGDYSIVRPSRRGGVS